MADWLTGWRAWQDSNLRSLEMWIISLAFAPILNAAAFPAPAASCPPRRSGTTSPSTPPRPCKLPACRTGRCPPASTSTVTLLTEQALSAALSLGETVVAVAVAGDQEECEHIRQDWERWKCAVPLEVLLDPHRSLIRTVLRYVESIQAQDATITVLIPEIIPSKRRHEILHNQRGRLLETVLKSRTTGVVVATLPFHIHD